MIALFLKFLKADWISVLGYSLGGWLSFVAVGFGGYDWGLDQIVWFLRYAPAFLLIAFVLRFGAFFVQYRLYANFDDAYSAFVRRPSK